MPIKTGTTTLKTKRSKKVRWGVVQTREFEVEHQSVGERDEVGVSDQEAETKEVEGKKGREVWASVEMEGEHEQWGPMAGSDDQLE